MGEPGRPSLDATVVRPVLVVVTGLPGVGKSAVAPAVARRLGGCVLSVDPIEDAMLRAGVPRSWESGVAAYEVAAANALQNLLNGLPVVVDAVSDTETSRRTWRTAAATAGSAMKIVELLLPDQAEQRRRLDERARGLGQIPEPSWKEVQDRRRRYEPWREDHLVLDTSGALDDIVDAAYEYVADPR